jgi:hypothetical protein
MNVQYSLVTNTTGAILTSAPLAPPISTGEYRFNRIFSANDVGVAAGQTRDNTDPAVGCLLGQIQGSRVLMASISPIYRPGVVIQGTTWIQQVFGALDDSSITTLQIRLSYDAVTGFTSFYLLDGGLTTGQIEAGDYIMVYAQLGNGNQQIVPY